MTPDFRARDEMSAAREDEERLRDAAVLPPAPLGGMVGGWL